MNPMKRKCIDPSYFNLFIAFLPVIHLVLPIRSIIHPPLTYFGLVAIIAGVALNKSAVGLLRRKLTTVTFGEKPSVLVTDGPYRISRNPIYLGGVVVLLGESVFLGSLVTLIFPFILFLLLDRIYIPDEETLMEKEFGLEYLHYKKAVRRWL